MSFGMTASRPPGLRERKRQQTLQRITDAAMRLFAQRGYDETTLEAVAEAAEISQRGFFHYFASKEDILASWQAGMPGLLEASIMAQPEGMAPLQMLRQAVSHMPNAFDPQLALAINRIIRGSEQLRASNNAKMVRLEQVAFEALCVRFGDGHDRASLRMIAMVAVGAVRIALDGWGDDDGGIPVGDHIDRTFDALTAVLPRA